MTNLSQDERFRQAADDEGGMPISAGARGSHVRLAVELGRTFLVDLTDVPADKRTALIAQIKELVEKAGAVPPKQEAGTPANQASN